MMKDVEFLLLTLTEENSIHSSSEAFKRYKKECEVVLHRVTEVSAAFLLLNDKMLTYSKKISVTLQVHQQFFRSIQLLQCRPMN